MLFEQQILTLPVETVRAWAYSIVLVASTLEAMPLFGVLVPGQTFVTIAGFFSRVDTLQMPVILFAGSLGAVLGDIISFAIGRRYGPPFIEKYGKYFFMHPERFQSTKKMIQRNAGKTLILGRFTSFTRGFAPFAAGSCGVGFPRFLKYAIPGGILWAAVFSSVGYIFGAGYRHASKYLGEGLLGVLLLAIPAFFIYKYLTRKDTEVLLKTARIKKMREK